MQYFYYLTFDKMYIYTTYNLLFLVVNDSEHETEQLNIYLKI